MSFKILGEHSYDWYETESSQNKLKHLQTIEIIKNIGKITKDKNNITKLFEKSSKAAVSLGYDERRLRRLFLELQNTKIKKYKTFEQEEIDLYVNHYLTHLNQEPPISPKELIHSFDLDKREWYEAVFPPKKNGESVGFSEFRESVI